MMFWLSDRPLVRVILFVLCASEFFASPARADIGYLISVDHPEQHLFHVTMTIPDVKGGVTVQMAAWNALYQIRDFASHVGQVQAFVGPVSAPIERMDKQTWRIQANGTVTVKYAAYWDEAGPFAAQLNSDHAFINPAMILMYVPERRSQNTTLSVYDLPDGWNAASSDFVGRMGVGGSKATFILFRAPSYDALADEPIEVGKFQEFDLEGVTPRVSVVVHGKDWNKEKIEDELKRICEYEVALMGGAPYDHYVFLLHIGQGFGGGGMEHANATAISVPSDEYLAGVAAHEFFHLWNVKRIRPATLEPVDFTKEQYTRALWFAEGVTSTYGAYTLERSGIWSKERFYADLGDQITELESRAADHWQSAEESSLDAWLEKYPLYNGPDYSVSYYTKGQVLGDLLDILIRDRTNNAKSLDDVFRAMNADFAKQGRFYRDSLDVRLEAEKVAGGSFEQFFRDYVAHADALPYAQVLGLAGLTLQTSEHKRAALGFAATRDASGAMTVRTVDADSPAAAAGLRQGDLLWNWNGGDVPRFLGRWVRDRQPGETVKVRVRRDDKEVALEFKLGESKVVLYEVAEDAQAGEKAQRIREGWLHGITEARAAAAAK